MITQVTKGIKISVKTSFEGTYFKNYKIHFAFSYQVTIENQSKDFVQVYSRHWEIFDALNPKDVVIGEGVVGQKPIIKPGDSYTYKSGCLLASPHGSMRGFYSLTNFSTSKAFRVLVPSFKFHAPFALN